VLTDTDIPPGGEGKIEVTYDSGSKKGKQEKTITVTSNDPRRATAKLQITAFIEVDFGFVPSSIGFGKIDQNQTSSKSATILVKDPSHTKLADLQTSSDFVRARVNDQDDRETSGGSITVEITLVPGLPPGRFNEFVTATSTDTSLPEAKLRVGGNVIGDVDVNPNAVRFVVREGDSSRVTPGQRKITITNHSDDRPLKITGVRDPDDRVTLDLRTLEEGQRFELLVSPKDLKSTATNLSGSIMISTNSPSQNNLAVRYTISYRE
jgi:hypothetical protein